MSDLPSFQALYDAGKAEAIARSIANGTPLSDFTPGSGIDIDLGIAAAMGEELVQKIVNDTRKVFLDTARAADLDAFAYDRYRFVRLAATSAQVVLTFTRPSGAAPAGTIARGTTVLTAPDADGTTYSFTTDSALPVALNQLTASVTATCTTPGPASVGAAKLTTLQSPVSFDSTFTVSNTQPASGGNDAESDEVFRARVRKGAAKTGTADSVIAGVLADVPQVRRASLLEFSGGATLYVGDSVGASNDTVVGLVQTIIGNYRSAGVSIFVDKTTQQFVVANVACIFQPGRDSQATRVKIVDAAVAAINNVTSQAGATLYRDVVEAAVHSVADSMGLISCSVTLALEGSSTAEQDIVVAGPSVVVMTNSGLVTTS